MAKRVKKRRTRTSARKYYILRQGRTSAIFTGRQPRQAALKAATRGFKDITLRERGRRNRDGTYSIHIFKGSRVKLRMDTEDRPEWLPKTVWKPRVRKMRVDRVTRIR
ncbi:MAG: non-histone chromosomal MC1 family protein [Nanoarchaeota archaeon]|nr:non-histone chromosomal MC1 family protein [Nanoarchaeota archaeon]